MKLSETTLKKFSKMIMGDSKEFPNMSLTELMSLFEAGDHQGFSRMNFTLMKLKEINGSAQLKRIFELILSESHFQEKKLSLEKAANTVNNLLSVENYRVIRVGNNYKVSGEQIEVGGIDEAHFEEIELQIIKNIKEAKYLIWIAIAWFTNVKIFNELKIKKEQGLSIRIIINHDFINCKENGLNFSEVAEIKLFEKKGRFENIMHNKFCIIDLETVIHGSYNWSKKANYNNETIQVEPNNSRIAKQFADEFLKIWNE